MRKLILAIPVVVLLVAVGLYFHYTRQVERHLQVVAGQLAIVGQLDWDRVWIHPSGEVRADRLTFMPHAVNEEIRIERLVIRAPGLMALIQSATDLNQGRLPETLSMSIQGLQAPLEGSRFDRLQTDFSSGFPFEAIGCDDRNRFTVSDLARMDYFDLAFDLDVGYELTDSERNLELRLNSVARNISGLDFRIRFRLDSLSREIDLLMRAWGVASIEEIEWRYHNLGFRERATRFCSEQLQISPEHFIDHHLNHWMAAWSQIGIAPGTAVRSAYRQFLDQPREFSIEARPKDRLAVSALARLEPRELLDRLELLVGVNRGTPGVVSVTAADSPVSAPQLSSRRSEEAGEDVPASPWIDISAGSAAQHIGARVVMQTIDGTRVQGQLVDVDENLLHVRIRSAGGFYVRPFERDRITELRVRR